jgi:transposase
VGSARALERLCEAHYAYRWICGGIAVSAHTLSDFRVRQGAVLDDLLTQSVGQLLAEGLVELTHVTQDGIRVRASAGAGSYRRRQRRA